MTARTTLQLLGTAIAAALLAACGGDGGTSAAAVSPTTTPVASGTQIATGTITGFGSVIVDGVRYDDSGATVKAEDDAAAPQAVSLSDLKLGMRVELKADDDGRTSAVTVSSEVVGRIRSLSKTGFVVAGQTVVVSEDPAAPTVFEGVSGLAGLAVADVVEVHGVRDASGAVLASRIERKDPSSAVVIRVVGTVAEVDATARSFRLAGLTVRWDASTRLLPAGTAPTAGQRVAVWTDVAIGADDTVLAKSIVVRRSALANNDSARVGGVVRALDFGAKRFRVDGVDVDAATASFSKGTAADLAEGRRVRIRGTFVDGVLKASEVRFVREQGDASVELTGVVTDFAMQQFKVRGVPVDVSGTGIEYRGGTVANLGDGVLIRIEGEVAGSLVRPRSVEFVTSADARSRWLFGEVATYDVAAGTFGLMGLDAKLAATTTFRNADGSTADRASFGNGDRVRVRGAFVAGVFVVTEVMFRPAVQTEVDDVEGSAYDVDLAAGTFRLNGTLVRIGPSTVFTASRDALRDGVKVEVQGAIVAGELVATRVEIKTPGGEIVRVRGPLTDFVSSTSFRVAGQRIDASTASLEPSGTTLTSASEGRSVEAEGTVVEGVLKATRLRLR
jgi:hypothetical protein